MLLLTGRRVYVTVDRAKGVLPLTGRRVCYCRQDEGYVRRAGRVEGCGVQGAVQDTSEGGQNAHHGGHPLRHLLGALLHPAA